MTFKHSIGFAPVVGGVSPEQKAKGYAFTLCFHVDGTGEQRFQDVQITHDQAVKLALNLCRETETAPDSADQRLSMAWDMIREQHDQLINYLERSAIGVRPSVFSNLKLGHAADIETIKAQARQIIKLRSVLTSIQTAMDRENDWKSSVESLKPDIDKAITQNSQSLPVKTVCAHCGLERPSGGVCPECKPAA